MDFRQLRYFLEVVDAGSFTTAASQLGVAQPSLTKSVRLLEESLGVTLLRRLPRGVEPTAFGERLARHARAISVQLDDAAREIEGVRDGISGSVAIGAGPAWLRRHLPLAVARAAASEPGLRVHVAGGFDEALLHSLRAGALDFVIAELPSPDRAAGLSLEPLVSDRLGVCCRADHPLLGRRVNLTDLLAYPWAMPPEETRARRRFEALFVARNLPAPSPAVETSSMAFLLQIVRSSDALTYTVQTTLEGVDGVGLAFLDIPELRATRDAGLIARAGAWLSPAAEAVIRELRAICAADPRN